MEDIKDLGPNDGKSIGGDDRSEWSEITQVTQQDIDFTANERWNQGTYE